MNIHKPIEDSFKDNEERDEHHDEQEELLQENQENQFNSEENVMEMNDTEDITFTDKLICDICTQRFASDNSMKRHKMTKHPLVTARKVPAKGKRQMEEESDPKPKNVLKMSNIPKQMECNVCGHKVRDNFNIKKHLRTHQA
jgi:hypothetical protein